MSINTSINISMNISINISINTYKYQYESDYFLFKMISNRLNHSFRLHHSSK